MFPLSCGVDIGYRALLQRDSVASAGPVTLRKRASTDVASRVFVFLNVHRIIRKRMEDTVVALHPESIQGIVFSQGTEVL